MPLAGARGGRLSDARRLAAQEDGLWSTAAALVEWWREG